MNREYKITFPTSKFKHRYLIVFTEEDKFNMMTTPRMGFKILKVKYIFALLHFKIILPNNPSYKSCGFNFKKVLRVTVSRQMVVSINSVHIWELQFEMCVHKQTILYSWDSYYYSLSLDDFISDNKLEFMIHSHFPDYEGLSLIYFPKSFL